MHRVIKYKPVKHQFGCKLSSSQHKDGSVTRSLIDCAYKRKMNPIV